jgi:hypothetical protein
MNLTSERELANTKAKLALLEECYEESRTDPDEEEHLRELSLRSLKRLINQLKEEIARYEVHQAVRR